MLIDSELAFSAVLSVQQKMFWKVVYYRPWIILFPTKLTLFKGGYVTKILKFWGQLCAEVIA